MGLQFPQAIPIITELAAGKQLMRELWNDSVKIQLPCRLLRHVWKRKGSQSWIQLWSAQTWGGGSFTIALRTEGSPFQTQHKSWVFQRFRGSAGLSQVRALCPELSPPSVAQVKTSILLSQEHTEVSLSHERAHMRAGAWGVKEFLPHSVILLLVLGFGLFIVSSQQQRWAGTAANPAGCGCWLDGGAAHTSPASLNSTRVSHQAAKGKKKKCHGPPVPLHWAKSAVYSKDPCTVACHQA